MIVMPDLISLLRTRSGGIQSCSGFPLQFTLAKARAGMTVLASFIAGVITIPEGSVGRLNQTPFLAKCGVFEGLKKSIIASGLTWFSDSGHP